ncbi:MAG: signal recognition particle protein [Bacillota bacterium]|jgi:signal recognition particle subunit SRP54|nr:signal recognition particle protein [Bacillota bacterium]HHU30620.1 signal recognition particle protein [Bacillota bacterium]
MIFANLSEKLQNAVRRLRQKGKLTEKDIDAALREVRLALLEADVNFKVVKTFIADVRERCLQSDVMASLTPGQTVIKIVKEELTNLMGGKVAKLAAADRPPTVVMLVGLQGSGKTTSAAKLANLLKKQNRSVLLAAADIYRPAAIKQLQVLGEQLSIPVFQLGQKQPEQIARAALEQARREGYDYLIIDTAGRLHIDDEMMAELVRLEEVLQPEENLLVVDAMTGQDAVNVAQSFRERLNLTGVILTKLDGDSRGGAALSVKAVTGCPVKFAGVGEKTDAFEPFHPDRMASRILGMGDVLTLIEKAQSAFDEEKARELERKMRSRQFTLEDYMEQLQQLKKMGPLNQIIEMLPGIGGIGKKLKNFDVDESVLKKTEAIILSMTPEERAQPAIINSSRRRRIASGSGTRVQDVNNLLKQFAMMNKMMKQFGKMEKSMLKKKGKFPFM